MDQQEKSLKTGESVAGEQEPPSTLRTGLPVVTAFVAAPSKPMATIVARLASILLARPITALASWMTTGTLMPEAASTGGTVG